MQCPVVAIGASAGGLEFFERFFSRMSPASGMSFVLLQHLDPRYETLMPELLTKYTQMPVTKAEHGRALDANHVYVSPPNALLSLDGCVLQVTPAPHKFGEPKLIDHFFRSLAESQADGAVAIVLSGAGSDGTLGMKSVKQHGGLTMAQAPGTAKYDSMPRSAISSGFVDFVLTVDEMPDRIVSYVEHLLKLRLSRADQEAQAATDALAKICPILREKTGHDFSRYKQSTLIRRVNRRMQVTYTKSFADYIEFLQRSDGEKENLFKDLLIGVTQFFRDDAPFERLESKVIPGIFRDKPSDGQVRVWVSGCATGEEAYSIAMLLSEYMSSNGLTQRVQVFATELDTEALTIARKAQYTDNLIEQISPARLQRFFVRHGDTYEVCEEIREMCLFSPHNLIKDPPFSRLDLISCRNVLIYLEADAQRKLLRIFHYALNPAGFLFLGPSENVASRSELFLTVDQKARIFQRKPTMLKTVSSLPIIDGGRVTKPLPAGPIHIPMSKDQNVARTIERVIMEDYAPASVIINEQGEVVYFSGRTGKYLEPAVGSPSNKLLDMAKTAVRIELRTVVHRALKERKQALRENVVVQLDEKPQVLNLIVRPLPEVGKESGLFIVVFQEVVAGPSAPLLAQPLTQAEVVDPIVQQLEHELRTTREDLQTTIEELETSNEELKSANEELLSMNEELQSTNEELQTSKEEVQSINDELQRKVDELDAANADLHNLFQSTSVATVFLDNELRITRFTPAMYAVTRLGERELGRRLIDVAPELAGTYALEDMEEVLRAQTPREREMSVGGGQHWFIRRIMPYRSLDQSVKGLVLTFTEVTQLKRAEAQRAQLAAIVEGSQDAIIGHAPDGMISTWNSAAEAIYGFSAAEAIGKPISIIVPPQHAHEMPAIYAKLVRGEIVERFHTRRMTKGGELIDASITVSPIRDDHQRIVGFSSIARDVTQLMRAAEQHARLASIVESSDDAIVSKNLDGIVTSWNRGAERIFGYSSEEMVGKPITTIIPADRQHEEPAILARLRRGERIDHYETIRQHKNGGLIDVSVTISPIRNAVGEVTGASKIARDITDERKAEREIELSYRFQAQLASIVESSDDAIISKNLDGIVTSWNRGAERIFGYTSAEMIGKPITTIIPANRQDEEPTILARLRRGERIDHYETVRQRKDGTLLDVSATISPIRNAEGTIIGASKVARDVTEQKQAERLLHEAKESLEKQVALRTAHLNETVHSLESVCYTMAHDLRAPLRSLHGYAEILAEECGSSLDPETKLCTERITTATSRMEQLIEDLLQFAKLGHIDLPVERLDVRTELDRILETIAPEIEVKGAIITLPEPGETAVLANATVFRQVMLNLIVNGMKFVAQNAKPQINITAAKEGPTVRICVKDNGIGIAREHHDRIFGLFQRLHSAEKYPGTGVGLAIVKRGVERMGGRVTLISERGMGSTFCVELPIAK